MSVRKIGGIVVSDITRAGRHIVRMTHRGWVAEVEDNAVTIPRQKISPEMNTADLAVCLDAAIALTRRSHSPAQPATEKEPGALEADVADVMHKVIEVFEQQWGHFPGNLDIYQCIATAWEQSAMTVPHKLLVNLIRGELPDSDHGLLDFNDTATRDEVRELLVRAEGLAQWAADRARSRPQTATTPTTRGVA